jgi:hypothetical protein
MICYVVGIYDDMIITLGREIIRMSEPRKLVPAWAFSNGLAHTLLDIKNGQSCN